MNKRNPSHASFGEAKPEMLSQWHSTKNESLNPFQISPFHAKAVWWLCEEGHEWEQAPTRRSSIKCAICEGRILQIGVNDFATLYPLLATDWHPTKNGSLLPSHVVFKHSGKVWWLGKCGHEWFAALGSRVFRGTGCPICANQVVLPGFNDLATTYPPALEWWDYEANGGLLPTGITRGANVHVAWHDRSCGHKWVAKVAEVAKPDGTRCPFCNGNRVLTGFNDLETVCPRLLTEWDWEKNEILPSEILAEGKTKVWWRCKNDHSWNALIHPRIHRGVGCPRCKTQSSWHERLLFETLSEMKLGNIERSLPIEAEGWSNRYSKAVVDLYFETMMKKVIVEYDGSYWHRDKIATDLRKTIALLNAGYHVVRLRDTPLDLLPIIHDRLLQLRVGSKAEVYEAPQEITRWALSESYLSF